MPDKIDFFNKKEEVNDKLPRVTERLFDKSGRLKSMTILVEQGTIPVTGEQYAEWYRQKYFQLEEIL